MVPKIICSGQAHYQRFKLPSLGFLLSLPYLSSRKHSIWLPTASFSKYTSLSFEDRVLCTWMFSISVSASFQSPLSSFPLLRYRTLLLTFLILYSLIHYLINFILCSWQFLYWFMSPAQTFPLHPTAHLTCFLGCLTGPQRSDSPQVPEFSLPSPPDHVFSCSSP